MPTMPSGADPEVTFISGITSESRLAGTAFATWKRDSPATYSTTTSYEVKWGSTTPGTSGGTVTYFFDTASNWSTTEKNAISAALSLWSAEANISFSLSSTAASANQIFYRDATGTKQTYQSFTSSTLSTVGSGADGHAISSKIVIDTSQPYWHVGTSFDDAGGFGWQTVVHEIGHMLGLGHGGPYNGNVNASTQQFSAYDTRLWTLMSYIDPNVTTAKYYSSYPVTGTAWGVNGQGYRYQPTTPMMLDVLAIQQIYGAPTSGPLAAGGVTFGFNSNIAGSVKQFFDFTVNQHPVVTLWSGGSNNTLDLSGFSAKSTINLNPGTFSSANGMVNNIAIAMDTVIERAIGGAGNDVLIGSTANNAFRGNAGNDTIDGSAGMDTAIFSGTRSQYTLTALGSTGVRVVGPDGTDTLSNVERLQFNDQTVAWPAPATTTSDDFANGLIDSQEPLGQVSVGGTATGSLETAGDRDWFSVQLTAGTSYTINLSGSPSGVGTLTDAYVRVRNSSGTLIVENNDVTAGSNRDSQVTFVATTTGTYYVEAGASGDTLTGTYRVSAGLTASAADDFANSFTDASHPFGSLAVGASTTGRLETGADRDWFRVQLTAGTAYTVNLTGQQAGGGTLEDPYVRIHNSTGAVLFENDDIITGTNRDSRISFTATTTGTYYVDAGSFGNTYSGTYTVRLSTAGLTDDYAGSLTDTARPFGLLTANGSTTGNIERVGDRDWFSVQLTAGTTYDVHLDGRTNGKGTLEDPYLRVHNSTGAIIAQNDDILSGVIRDSLVTFRPTATGTYYLEAGAFEDSYAGTYALGVSGGATTLGVNLVDDSITKLYVGYYNRAPDYSGETYWADCLQSGMKLGQIAQSFSVQTESTSLYSFLANPRTSDATAVGTFVDAVYSNLFNRAPDSAGKAYWVGQLMTGASSAGSAILCITNGTLGNDSLTVQNKVTVGNYYDTQTFASRVQFTLTSAQDVVKGVDSTTASVTAGRTKVDLFVATAQRLEVPPDNVPLVGIDPDHFVTMV